MTTTETDGAAGSALSYEQARAELVEVVRKLEAGGSTLEESLELWERGEELAGICREWLEGARARLDAVLEAEDEESGEASDSEADDEEEDEDDEGDEAD
ncbi:hypothetical protein GCM10009801_26400 [Streptomyces albiaxialis]|uniref:Exodeoxyribonuclease 7 small subunit n=1 Tax=Streptomyces albiaxialis TaxID=329523 RepID=A0ABN2VV96_9ACTN